MAASLVACAGQVAQLRTDLAEQIFQRQLARGPANAYLRAFYAEHPQPLWIVKGAIRPEAHTLLLEGAPDGADVAAIVERSKNASPSDLAKAELALSTTLVKVALSAHGASKKVVFTEKVVFTDPSMSPPKSELEALRSAAKAPSLRAHLLGLRSGNILYAELAKARRATVLSAKGEAQVEANLERLRALPADLGERFVLIDIPAARLWMYEDGKPVSSMSVVVGAPEDATPLMVASLRYAVINPYWNLPPDLVSERIAPQVIRSGPAALKALNMEVLSGWSATSALRNATEVDWPAVARGQVIRVRQRPGAGNTLGRVKFVMPNNLGVYLHDTPERGRLSDRAAYRSAGCVRLDDADRLGRWLFGPTWNPALGIEARLTLAKPVPVYIVYRTARVENHAIVFAPDPYGLDGPLKAPLGSAALSARTLANAGQAPGA